MAFVSVLAFSLVFVSIWGFSLAFVRVLAFLLALAVSVSSIFGGVRVSRCFSVRIMAVIGPSGSTSPLGQSAVLVTGFPVLAMVSSHLCCSGLHCIALVLQITLVCGVVLVGCLFVACVFSPPTSPLGYFS